jgi:hypothetical protein
MRATKIITKANVIKIRFVADNGFGSAQIADAIGSTPGSVRCMCSKMTVCAVMTAAFLEFSKSRGNDLSTPLPSKTVRSGPGVTTQPARSPFDVSV